MPYNDIGPRGFHQAAAAATLSFTPQFDRAAVVSRLLIDKVSASDTWRVVVQGREVAAFDVRTTGNQQPLAGPYSGYPKNNDLFDIVREAMGEPLQYPVPLGQTFKVASDGGATANISIQFREVQPGELSQGMANHPQGNRMIVPIVGFRNATTAAAGEVAFDSQVAPAWFPNIFVDGILPPNWQIRILAMFLEGAGRNTFSGAADHQSVTSYLAVFRNGQRLYTRDNLGGIPLIGQASAAGSANTVVGTDETPNPPVQESDPFDWGDMELPLILGGGDAYQFRLALTGDVTGGADYSAARQLFLCDVRNQGV